VKSTNIRVSVSDGAEYAHAEWNETSDAAEIQVSNGGCLRMSPTCLELLHDALHEIFGKEK
jgi:hypothetical protein